MVCSHIHAEPLWERLKGLNELGVKAPYKKSMRVCGDEFVVQQQVDGGLAENEISQQ